MSYIRVTPEGTIWPYSLAQLRVDYPDTSFAWAPTADDLRPFGVHVITPTEPPAHDPRTHRAAEVHPIGGGETWTQAWEVVALTPDEIEAAKRRDWPAFRAALLADADVSAALVAAMATAPLAVLSLAQAIQAASTGDYREWSAAWPLVRSPAAQAAAVDAAVDAELPSAFVGAI